MTKILFGVCGVGYGHAVRSRILIEYLKKKHEVMIIAGMCAHSYLKDLKNIYWVDGLEWDWSISRDRHFGIPIPVWYCKKCGETVFAEEKGNGKGAFQAQVDGAGA